MHEVLVNRLGGLRLPRKSVVRLTDRPDMTLDVYRGRKTTIHQQCDFKFLKIKAFKFNKTLFEMITIYKGASVTFYVFGVSKCKN